MSIHIGNQNQNIVVYLLAVLFFANAIVYLIVAFQGYSPEEYITKHGLIAVITSKYFMGFTSWKTLVIY
jgi:hypothetical protein